MLPVECIDSVTSRRNQTPQVDALVLRKTQVKSTLDARKSAQRAVIPEEGKSTSYSFQSRDFSCSNRSIPSKEPIISGFEADSLFGAVFCCLGNKAGEAFRVWHDNLCPRHVGSAIVSATLCVNLPRGFGVERAVYFDTGHGEWHPRLNNAVPLLPRLERYGYLTRCHTKSHAVRRFKP